MYLRDVVAASGPSVNGIEVPDVANNGPRTMKTVWPLFAFATVFILLRLYSKARRTNALWWDDYVLLASWTSFLVACVQLSVSISNGFGRPSKTLEPNNLDRIGLGYLVLGTALLLASSGSKTSCVITMSRLSGTKLTVALWSITVSMNVLQTTNIVLLWVRCTPLEKTWNPTVGGSCRPWEVNLGVAEASAAHSGVVDLGLAMTPWMLLSKLNIKRREKIGVCLAMSMGVFAAAATFATVSKLELLASADFILQGGDLIILASVEIALTMVAASVPLLRTLVCDINASRGRRQAQDEDLGFRARILNIWQSVRGSSSFGNGLAVVVMEAGPSCHDQPPRAGMDHPPSLSKETVSYGPMSKCDLVKSHWGGGSGGVVIEMREVGGGDADQGDDADSMRQLNASSKGRDARSAL
ncbi:hypothetical protein MAPG_06020 [Magnaporthiopsis poae ATCC 64411]|uniref:Rhodopsin domain-containing protein n=1 Tax=Magnaporthiopsis poae (strain ATCC 64411 / 73-15) TaxID=644358 RepID=A0A0C4E0X8_MAGP6|nr:hypothetical protein MAPG_06020 [Magnaporthiopsis poae ATCC 64411]